MQAGCDLNAAGSEGRTPLMYAVLYNQPAAVRLLLERGADARAKDKQGLTAPEMARRSGVREIIALFQPEGR
ncbi:MAG: ankyrin repeat domain-containing protein [Blastocatellia bacterium]